MARVTKRRRPLLSEVRGKIAYNFASQRRGWLANENNDQNLTGVHKFSDRIARENCGGDEPCSC